MMSSSAYERTDRQKAHAVQSGRLSTGWNALAADEFGLLVPARGGTVDQPDCRPTGLVIEFL
jgi:hypothetical protein